VSVESIRSMLMRARELMSELEREYVLLASSDESFSPARSMNLTHEILEKCSNVLDQTMYLAWEVRIKPRLKKGFEPRGYFPAAMDENSYVSTLGQWGAKNLVELDPEFDCLLRSVQPMNSQGFRWLVDLKKLARQKHITLLKQVQEADFPQWTFAGGGAFGLMNSSGRQLEGLRYPVVRMPGAAVYMTFSLQIEGTDDIDAGSFCGKCINSTGFIFLRFVRELCLDSGAGPESRSR
jgi:hypothetical protein